MANKKQKIATMNGNIVLPHPKYKIGDVIDISTKSGNLPNRILIKDVVYKMSNTSGEWTYVFASEYDGKIHEEDGNDIKQSNHDHPVYSKSEIKQRYAEGWRFYGNFPHYEARARAEKAKSNERIRNIMICSALDIMGNPVNDKLAVWVRYFFKIDDKGIGENRQDGVLQIIK